MDDAVDPRRLRRERENRLHAALMRVWPRGKVTWEEHERNVEFLLCCTVFCQHFNLDQGGTGTEQEWKEWKEKLYAAMSYVEAVKGRPQMLAARLKVGVTLSHEERDLLARSLIRNSRPNAHRPAAPFPHHRAIRISKWVRLYEDWSGVKRKSAIAAATDRFEVSRNVIFEALRTDTEPDIYLVAEITLDTWLGDIDDVTRSKFREKYPEVGTYLDCF
jgi:hypothetical protein